MKILQKSILIALFFVPYLVIAQQLDQRIPASAQAVATINGEQLFSIFSVEKFNNTKLGQELVKEMKRDIPNFYGIQDVGIDLTNKGHFYYQLDGGISYFSMVFSLDNYDKFSTFFSEVTDLNNVQKWDGNTVMVERDAVIIFSENTLQFCFAEIPYSYVNAHKEELEQKYPDLKDDYQLRRALGKEMIFSKAKQNFTSGQSITTNSSYKASVDNEASTSVWINNYGALMGDYYQMAFGYDLGNDPSRNDLPNLSKMGLGSMAAHLYFNQGNMQFKSEVEFNDELKSSLKKVYKQKMNKSFYKYVNLDQSLGFMTYAINTENMLQEYPSLLVNMYGGMLPAYQPEMDVVADLITTMLDEEAIGELLTGNLLFVLDGVSEKEVEYVTYEYDEEYNEKKVTKTKNEVLPDFTLIIGTKRKDLAMKLAKIGVKYEAMTGSANRFKMNASSDFPLALYALLTDDAIILSTSEKNLGGSGQGTSSSMQKTINKNAMTWHIDIQKLMQNLPVQEFGVDQETSSLINKNLKSATLTSSKLKGNKVYSEFTISAPNNDINSLQLIMDLFDEVIK